MFGRRGGSSPSTRATRGGAIVAMLVLPSRRRLLRLPRPEVRDLLQVDHRRVGTELVEDVVRAPVVHQLSHRPRLVRGVAEGDRARGAGLRAGDRELVRLERALLERGAVLRLADALDAEGALLHHALAAHRDVRVELPVERLGERVLLTVRLAVADPVEVADLVRAVVGAVAGADAAVVHLDVEPVRRVVGRVDGEDRLAGRGAAVLAEHRHDARLEVRVETLVLVLGALVVALQPDPRHLAPAGDVRAPPRAVGQEPRTLPRGAHRRDVVLGVACGDAGRASRAAREVDRHRPAPLRHPAPVVGAVHPQVLGVGVAQQALRVVRRRRAEAGEEGVRGVAGELVLSFVRVVARAGSRLGAAGDSRLVLAARAARGRALATRRAAGARLLALRSNVAAGAGGALGRDLVGVLAAGGRAGRADLRAAGRVGDDERLADAAPVLPAGALGGDEPNVIARSGDLRPGLRERELTGAVLDRAEQVVGVDAHAVSVAAVAGEVQVALVHRRVHRAPVPAPERDRHGVRANAEVQV